MVDYNSIIEGTVKFRDGKKWKSRWCVMRKLSPVADCLHLQLYRDSKDRYKQGQTKASLSLQHFLAVESGFTLDKESNTIAIVCQDVTVILAFDTRERLIQWQVKIANNLGEDQKFLIQITSAPSKAKVASGPARLHIQDHRMSITSGVPPRLIGTWEIAHLRKYGDVDGRFCFEGGSRCGKGEGLYVCITDQGDEITRTIKLASEGKLATRRRPVSRKMSSIDSPRKQLHSRAETRISDVSCTEAFISNQQGNYPDGLNHSMCSENMNRSMCSDDGAFCGCSADVQDGNSRLQSSEDLLCPCRVHQGRSSPFWMSSESATGHHGNSELDSNYGCGDTASVSELHDPTHFHGGDKQWQHDNMPYDRHGITALERCASCISKLGAPSMSRSSTVTHANTPMTPFSPAWTMEPITPAVTTVCNHSRSNMNSSCDRVSLSSHGSAGSSGNSEYSVPRSINNNEVCWYDRPRTATGTPPPHGQQQPVIPPKSPKILSPQALPLTANITHTGTVPPWQSCPPSRPPKPAQLSCSGTESPNKKAAKKAPMPLPIAPPILQQPVAVCTCYQQMRIEANTMVGPYENYDVPKPLLGHTYKREQKDEVDSSNRLSMGMTTTDEYYSTPKAIKDGLATQYGNYDTPPSTKVLRKPCGCIVKLAKKSTSVAEEEDPIPGANCPCQRVMCWAGMMLPYCRRGNGMENTGVPIQKVKLSGEGKMPTVNASGEVAIYATVDKSKKTNRRSQTNPEGHPIEHSQQQAEQEKFTSESNYENIGAEMCSNYSDHQSHPNSKPSEVTSTSSENYQNIDFAQSLEYYENSKDLLQRAGLSQKDIDDMAEEINADASNAVSYSVNNGVKFCNKCGHSCHVYAPPSSGEESTSSESAANTVLTQSTEAKSNKQDDYLMMEPAKAVKTSNAHGADTGKPNGKYYPGYIPMSPITKALCINSQSDLVKRSDHNRSQLAEKAASIPSLTGPYVDRSRKRSEHEFPRIPGSAMMMIHHSGSSPYMRRHFVDSDERRIQLISRKRSSSADSSRHLDDLEELETPEVIEQTITSSCTRLDYQESLSESLTLVSKECPNPNRQSNSSINCSHETIVSEEVVESIDVVSDKGTIANEAEESVPPCDNGDDTSISSDSLRTLVRECLVEQQPQSSGSAAVHIRRSSSVPCKSGNNRDSSSSNDSGVSTGSLKHRGADFAEFELPLTTSMSTRRHHHAVSQHSSAVINCLHSSLPRRSKSVDPLRELTFQFQKVMVPAKSSSAEAEVPVCPAKRDPTKGYGSPNADGVIAVPYIDSRSTSSGTSDMSDYIETLSLSSHSSSDTPDSLRLMRPATTTLRPRSGNEYKLIDRSILEAEEMKGNEKISSQLQVLVPSQYPNIRAVLEKSESPSPGYMSSSPGHDREDQPLLPN